MFRSVYVSEKLSFNTSFHQEKLAAFNPPNNQLCVPTGKTTSSFLRTRYEIVGCFVSGFKKIRTMFTKTVKLEKGFKIKCMVERNRIHAWDGCRRMLDTATKYNSYENE